MFRPAATARRAHRRPSGSAPPRGSVAQVEIAFDLIEAQVRLQVRCGRRRRSIRPSAPRWSAHERAGRRPGGPARAAPPLRRLRSPPTVSMLASPSRPAQAGVAADGADFHPGSGRHEQQAADAAGDDHRLGLTPDRQIPVCGRLRLQIHRRSGQQCAGLPRPSARARRARPHFDRDRLHGTFLARLAVLQGRASLRRR